jgi:hypothetical protein
VRWHLRLKIDGVCASKARVDNEKAKLLDYDTSRPFSVAPAIGFPFASKIGVLGYLNEHGLRAHGIQSANGCT